MVTTPHQLSKLSRRKSSFGWAVAFLFFVLIPSAATADPHRFVSGQILVKTRTGVEEVEVETALNRHSARQHHLVKRLNLRVVHLPEANAEAALESLKRNPMFEFAERDYLAEAVLLPNDPSVLDGTAWHLGKIQAPLAWNLTAGNSNIVIAVLDSGIKADHPDLAGRIIPGYDFVSGDADPADDLGHGTAVAGVIAAAGNNGLGSAGVAFNTRILSVKVVDAVGYAAYSTLAQGIRYAVDQGARVINISIAGDAPSSALQDAINYAWSSNVVVVAAAGNNGNDIPYYPAACEHVMAVAATASDDSLATFSSFGTNIALAAPGQGILTTSKDPTSPFAAWSGTSLASPMVAAGAALVAAANPLLDNSQIVALLEQTADDLGPAGFDSAFGFGRLNVARAVAVAAGLTLEDIATPPAVTPPSVTPIPVAPELPAQPPTVSFSNPLTNTSVAIGASLSVLVNAAAAGTNSSVTNVALFLNEVPWSVLSAPPFAWNWKPFVAGNYALTAVATDDAGHSATSAVVSVRVYSNIVNGSFVAPLVIAISGSGTLKPNLNGSQLVVGRSYTMTAIPAAGQIFAGWAGITVANPLNPRLVFQMQPGLTLAAQFIPNPFLPAQGNYFGLVSNPDGVTPESSGTLALSVASLGAFSGRLSVGGTAYALRGALNRNGEATVSLPRGTNSPLTLSLHVALASGADEVSGSVSDGTWTSVVSGNRSVFSAARPATQAGRHAFILQTPDSGTNSAASGSSTISTAGRTTVTGALKDGRKFSLINSIAKTGDFPFYLSLGKSEAVIGWLSFPQTAPSAVGTVYWVKSGTNAFTRMLQAASVP